MARADKTWGIALSYLLAALAIAAAIMLCPAAAPAGSAQWALHLRAHLTPDALASWLAAPTATPVLLDACEIDNHDPVAVVVRPVALDAIVSAEWQSGGEVENATDGTAQAVVNAWKYVLRSK